MKLRAFLVVLLTLCATVINSRSAAGERGGPVRIGVSLSLSGEFQRSGNRALAGARLRIDDHNATAGKDDFTVELVVLDNASDAATAAANVSKFADMKIPAVLGPLSTNLMRSMRDVAAERRIVLVSPSVTSPLIGRDRDWAVRLLFDDEFQGVALARYLYHELGIRKVASLTNSHLAYANSVNNAFKRVFEEEGGTMVYEESYRWVADEDGSHDFVPALKRIAESDPEMILLPNNSADVMAIIRQALETSISVPFCGGDTWLHETILVSSGNKLENSVLVSGINYEADTPAMKHFLYLFDHSNDPEANQSSVLGYDAMSLIIEGLRNGHTGDAVRDGLYKIRNFPLATGTITIDPERGSEKSAYIHRITKEGGGFVSKIVAEVKP